MTTTNPFRSERLEFHGFESPKHDDFYHEINSDPISFANACASIPRPVDRKFTEEQQKWHLDNALLFVVIYRRTDCTSSEREMKDTGDAKATTAATTSGSLASEDEPQPIGILFLESSAPDEAHHRCSVLAIDIKSTEQGKGYATEAINWGLEWAFQSAGLHRVELEYLGWNSRVRNLYERVGFREEGRRRERHYKDGKWWDEVYMGILESDWKQRLPVRSVE